MAEVRNGHGSIQLQDLLEGCADGMEETVTTSASFDDAHGSGRTWESEECVQKCWKASRWRYPYEAQGGCVNEMLLEMAAIVF